MQFQANQNEDTQQAADIINYALGQQQRYSPRRQAHCGFYAAQIFWGYLVGEALSNFDSLSKGDPAMNADEAITTHVHLLRSEGGRMVTLHTVVMHPGGTPEAAAKQVATAI